jgi:hypothetical protein
MVDDMRKTYNSDFAGGVKSFAIEALKQNENSAPGSVYGEYVVHLLEGDLGEIQYWDVKRGWQDGDVQFEGAEAVLINNVQTWEKDKIVTFMKAWDLGNLISQEAVNALRTKMSQIEVEECLAKISGEGIFREFIENFYERDAKSGGHVPTQDITTLIPIISKANKAGFYLLSLLMIGDLYLFDTVQPNSDEERLLKSEVRRAIGALSSWFTYDRYNTSVMAHDLPMDMGDEGLPGA